VIVAEPLHLDMVGNETLQSALLESIRCPHNGANMIYELLPSALGFEDCVAEALKLCLEAPGGLSAKAIENNVLASTAPEYHCA
jgi:hypothetical protein